MNKKGRVFIIFSVLVICFILIGMVYAAGSARTSATRTARTATATSNVPASSNNLENIVGLVDFRGLKYFADASGKRNMIYIAKDWGVYLQRPSKGGISTDYFVFDTKIGEVTSEPAGNFIDLDDNIKNLIGEELFSQLNKKNIDDNQKIGLEAEPIELKIDKDGAQTSTGIIADGRGYLHPSNNQDETIGAIDKTGKILMYDPGSYTDATKASLEDIANQIHNTRATRGVIADLNKVSDDGYASAGASRRVAVPTPGSIFMDTVKRTGQRLIDALTGKRTTPSSIDSSERSRTTNPITNPGRSTIPTPGNPSTRPSPGTGSTPRTGTGSPGTRPSPTPSPGNPIVKPGLPTPTPKPTPKPKPNPKPVNASAGGGIKPSTPKNCYDGTVMGTTSPLQCGCKTDLSYVKSNGKCNVALGGPIPGTSPAYRSFKCVKPNGDDAQNMVWQQDVDNCCDTKGGDGYCAQQYPKQYPICDTSTTPGKCIAGCTKNSDCPSVGGVQTNLVCDTSTNPGSCVECKTYSDCKSSSKPACDSRTKTCVQCTDNSIHWCASGSVCDVNTDKCVSGCMDTGDCPTSDGNGGYYTCVVPSGSTVGQCQDQVCLDPNNMGGCGVVPISHL